MYIPDIFLVQMIQFSNPAKYVYKHYLPIKNAFPVRKLSRFLWRFVGANFARLTQMLNGGEI